MSLKKNNVSFCESDVGKSGPPFEQNVKRDHLTKDERFPRLFKEVARILREVKSQKKSIKTAVYSTRLRGSNFKKIYALAYNVLKHLKIIDCVIHDIKLLIKEPRLNEESAEIMIHEIAIQNRLLPGQSKPVLIIQKYQDDIMKAFKKISVKTKNVSNECNASSKHADVHIPRYARVNSLISSVPKVLKKLKKLGFYHIAYNDSTSLADYQESVQNLKNGEFMQDFHFKDILVFSSSENLSQLNLYENGSIFLQDKSSYIPVHVLSPAEGSTVLDCCAAPGMKTVHLASLMKNSGCIYAVDRDENRFATLKEMLHYGGVSNCEPICADVLTLDPTVEPYCNVKYILLDPSCSGSGMISRLDNVTDSKNSKNYERIQKLSRFQITLLKYALSFPNVKRVVYSTCSTNEEENEYVVHEAFNHYSDKFKIIPAVPEWPERGLDTYPFGSMCLRACPEKNLTNGFFVAIFKKRKEKSAKHKKVPDNVEKSKDQVCVDTELANDSVSLLETDDLLPCKKKKKKTDRHN